jgi:hypothetical protein
MWGFLWGKTRLKFGLTGASFLEENTTREGYVKETSEARAGER